MLTRIYVVNTVAAVSREELHTMCWACTCQIATDFAPAWGLEPVIVEDRDDESDLPTGPEYALIRLANQADAPDALGDHFEYGGRILGTIGIAPVLLNGGFILDGPLSVSGVLSHEVLETLRNQFVNEWWDGPDGREWAAEVCDPVESDSYPYDVKNVGRAMVSNFILPPWADPQGSGKVDFMGTCPGPFQVAPGGYAVVREPGGVPQEIFGEGLRRPWRTLAHGLPEAKGPGWRSRTRLGR